MLRKWTAWVGTTLIMRVRRPSYIYVRGMIILFDGTNLFFDFRSKRRNTQQGWGFRAEYANRSRRFGVFYLHVTVSLVGKWRHVGWLTCHTNGLIRISHILAVEKGGREKPDMGGVTA